MKSYLLGRRVLGDGLGTLRDSMLGELTRKDETDSSLDLARRQSSLTSVTDETASFSSNALKDIVDERVHDRHSTTRDTGLRMDLLENTVDVDTESLGTLLGALLSTSRLDSLLDCDLTLTLSAAWRHIELVVVFLKKKKKKRV
jgi:phage gp46-like protein